MNNYNIEGNFYYINLLTWAGSRTISLEGFAIFYDPKAKIRKEVVITKTSKTDIG